MADSYIIDGYNLIHALGMIQKNMPAGGLDASRRQLLAFLARAFGDAASAVTVVFDARHAPRRAARQQQIHGLHVHFAPKNQSADDWIETLIEATPEPRGLVVVSNDHRLQSAAQRRGARAWTHEALLDFLDMQGTPKPAAGTEEPRPGLTAEEREHWLREFKALESDPELKEFFDLDRFD
jgi:predicted RNA-binding protein with PIN domain